MWPFLNWIKYFTHSVSLVLSAVVLELLDSGLASEEFGGGAYKHGIFCWVVRTIFTRDLHYGRKELELILLMLDNLISHPLSERLSNEDDSDIISTE